MRYRLVSFACLSVLSALGFANPTYTCQDIGNLGQPWETVGTAINDNTQITGYSHQSNDDASQTFFWSGGAMTNLWFTVPGMSPWAWCAGNAISITGAIAGNTMQIEHNFHPAFWPANRSYTYDLWPTQPSYGWAMGINDSDVVVGMHTNPSGGQTIPFKYENGVRTDLTSLGLLAGDYVYAINNPGAIVGQGLYPESYPLYLKDGVRTILSVPSGYPSGTAFSVNNLGQMAGELNRQPVGNVSMGMEGFFTRPQTPGSPTQKIRMVGTLGGRDSFLKDINDFGDAVGWSHISGGGYVKHAIVWLGGWDGSMVDLHNATTNIPSGYVLEEATSINNKGEIVALGRKAVGNEIHTFLLTRTDW